MSISFGNPLVTTLIGLILGLGIGWIWRNTRVRELARELAACRPRAARLHQVEEILAERNGQLAALQTEISDLREAQARGSLTALSAPQAPPQQGALPLVGESPKRRKSGSRAS